jgi:hypothetical protein
MMDCQCHAAVLDESRPLIEAFEEVRESCQALRLVCVPDDTWPAFKAWHLTQDTVALHHSVFVLALDRGHLARLTAPIHRYLIQNGEVLPSMRAQYREDLKERWMLDPDPLRRHQLCRIYLGRITELQVAEWLETQGWTVTGIEALREGPDVTARHSSEGECDFEIKMVGTEDADFESILQAIASEPAGRVLSPYQVVNYLLFRAYEAAIQLQRSGRRRAAVVVVSDWDRFKMQFEGGWVDWAAPQFMPQDGSFLPWLQAHYTEATTATGLRDALSQVNILYLLRRGNGYSYLLEGTFRYGA